MWRYRELLPIDGEPTVGRHVGGTPLIRADRLAEALGVARALHQERRRQPPDALVQGPRRRRRAVEGASSSASRPSAAPRPATSPDSVAANAAPAGLDAYVLIPDGLEQGKILGATIYGAKVIAIEGNYDHVNRLCSQIAFRFGWGFVNVNLRPFYAEGSKSMGFEIAEDLGWRLPRPRRRPDGRRQPDRQDPQGVQGVRAARPDRSRRCAKMFGAQATGCNPISNTVKTGRASSTPVRNPNTIAKSLAIGDPADGYFASKLIRDTGGWSEDVDDDAIVDAMQLLAETEGIWAETAGGVTLAVARKLIEQGKIDRDGSTVLCITGNGLKTQEALVERIAQPVVIKPTLEAFEALVDAASRHAELVGADGAARDLVRTLTGDHRTVSMPHVRIPTPLAPPRRRQRRVEAAGATVGEVLADLGRKPSRASASGLFDGEELRRFVNVYVNNEDIRYLDDLDTAVADERRGQHHPGRRRRLSSRADMIPRPIRAAQVTASSLDPLDRYSARSASPPSARPARA